jgi:uncharacterized protein with ATP-grasp and redox domains
MSFKVDLDCFPCFLRQAVIAVRLGGVDGELAEKAVRAALDEINSADTTKSPAHATTLMHRRIREVLGMDPFEGVKSEYNRRALTQYPELKRMVSSSPDPLETASRLAIAGNVIDFGIFSSVDVEGAIAQALDAPLAVGDYRSFRRAVEGRNRVLYLVDNAGEVVFDRLLIEALVGMGKEVTAVVKGGAVINDCTLTDALEVGLDGICEIMDNGSDAVGTILETTTGAFRKRFWDLRALVISKGQGNFETLLEEDREGFFLFQSKCGVLSRALGVAEGSMMLLGRGGNEGNKD